jgi:hypothetical protein
MHAKSATTASVVSQAVSAAVVIRFFAHVSGGGHVEMVTADCRIDEPAACEKLIHSTAAEKKRQ